ncbi:dephospho-CoA kinase [Companilactobacillus crustorum]|nr:dephospho-CoA kinase [Companilactobacillus crustorum]WDT64663.1 dephospho-CoA kinase [Companilactobacillus crustorum]GEO77045.1 dephospho-CoA kinase [Companilactobacillus crustorum]HCD07316.1 dephospho-CoA kinase [Lactobacillus sp.]
MSKIYGLTGGIAAGKSTVLDFFKTAGCKVYDADQIARQVVEPGTVGLQKIAQQFGSEVILSDGTLDRARLGSLVFGNPLQLQALNKITRPLIKAKILKIIQETKASTSDTIAIFEIQLLFEGNYQQYFDGVIAIYVTPEVQLHRLMKRNNLTKKVAMDRINSQMSMDEKRSRADFVLDNSGDLTHLADEFDHLFMQL